MTDEEIYALGMDLELAGFSHSEIDTYFQHAGVKGMKWGVRKSRKETGLTRPRGASIDRNNRQIYRRENALDGTSYKRTMAVGRKVVTGTTKIHGLLGYHGVKTLDNQLQLSIKDLKQQNRRLRSGKLFVSDRKELYNIALPALIISRKPKRHVKQT